MKITITPARLMNGGKPYINARTGVGLDEEDIIEMVTRKIRQRLATLEDNDDKMTIEILIDDVDRD